MFIDSQCWIAVTFWFATCKPPRYLNPRVLSQGFLLGKDSSGFVQGLCKGGPHVLGRCQRWGSLRDPLRQHVHATSLGEFCLAILRLHPKDPCFDHMLCFCHALDSAASVLGLAGRDTAEKRFDAVDAVRLPYTLPEVHLHCVDRGLDQCCGLLQPQKTNSHHCLATWVRP